MEGLLSGIAVLSRFISSGPLTFLSTPAFLQSYDYALPWGVRGEAGYACSFRLPSVDHEKSAVNCSVKIVWRSGCQDWCRKGGEQIMKFIPWILAIMAGWLIAAPVVLGYANTAEIAMKNDVGVGMVMLIGTLCWGVLRVAPPWAQKGSGSTKPVVSS